MTLKEAARHTWRGHDDEFETHWRFAHNYKKRNPSMYRRTIYPSWMRAWLYLITHPFS
jgi:hypothetical protein